MSDWFARAVLHVTDVPSSVRFYEQLGFASPWNFDDVVAQVERQGCAIILSSQWPEKVGKGLVFVSLNVPDARRSLDALRVEFESRGVKVKDGNWGYKLLVIDDPDGNQLFFNYPNQD